MLAVNGHQEESSLCHCALPCLSVSLCLTVLVICLKVLQNTQGLIDSVKWVWRSNRRIPTMEIFDLNEKYAGAGARKAAQWVKCVLHKQASSGSQHSCKCQCACEEGCL